VLADLGMQEQGEALSVAELIRELRAIYGDLSLPRHSRGRPWPALGSGTALARSAGSGWADA